MVTKVETKLFAHYPKYCKKELPEITETIIARISANEFAFLLTRAEKEDIDLYLQSLIRLINQEVIKAGCPANEDFYIGLSLREEHTKAAELMAQSDNALQQAAQQKKVSVWSKTNSDLNLNREQWRQLLVGAIDSKLFTFMWQPVHAMATNEVLHRELYCQINSDNKRISAREFMPFVDFLALGTQLDKSILKAVVEQGIFSKLAQPLAINLTLASVSDDNFLTWLTEFLSTVNSKELMFELPESAVIAHTDKCLTAAQLIKTAGASIGIDQCGRQLGSLDYLQQIKPNYIKLDQSFAFLEATSQHKELCRAVVNIAKGLSIEVILTGIEDAEQLSQFATIQADGYQGYISPLSEVNES